MPAPLARAEGVLEGRDSAQFRRNFGASILTPASRSEGVLPRRDGARAVQRLRPHDRQVVGLRQRAAAADPVGGDWPPLPLPPTTTIATQPHLLHLSPPPPPPLQPLIFYWKIFSPCWECFDFEGAATHEVSVLSLRVLSLRPRPRPRHPPVSSRPTLLAHLAHTRAALTPLATLTPLARRRRSDTSSDSATPTRRAWSGRRATASRPTSASRARTCTTRC